MACMMKDMAPGSSRPGDCPIIACHDAFVLMDQCVISGTTMHLAMMVDGHVNERANCIYYQDTSDF